MTESISFEWDEVKNSENIRKHGVRFEEAASAFADENARIIADPDHSDDEERFVLIGLSQSLKLVVVCHCYRSEEQVIRIISARSADARERHTYREYLL